MQPRAGIFPFQSKANIVRFFAREYKHFEIRDLFHQCQHLGDFGPHPACYISSDSCFPDQGLDVQKPCGVISPIRRVLAGKVFPYTGFQPGQQDAVGVKLASQMSEQIFGGEDRSASGFVKNHIAVENRQQTVCQRGFQRS